LIMQEFYTTEQHYVEALQLLVEVSDFASRCIIELMVLNIIVLSIRPANRTASRVSVTNAFPCNCNSATHRDQWNSPTANLFF